MVDTSHELERLQNDLEALAARVPESDAITIKVVREQLNYLKVIEGELEELRESLLEIDEQCADDEKALPSELGPTELAASIFSISKVFDFLTIRAPSTAIDRLQAALIQLAFGHRPAMFQLQSSRGRPPDVPVIQQIKGAMAGVMHAQQVQGMSRHQAAAWIAANISSELASRISGKPITARMVEEWLDRYGGRSPPDDPGGETFKVWSNTRDSHLSGKRFREMTERMAKIFPARKK